MLVYNEFKSVMSQRVVVEQLLPIARAEVERRAGAPAGEPRSITCTSRRRRRSSTSCCRATSRCRSTARCSNRTPPIIAAQMTAMDTATQERGGHDRQPDAVHEQGPPGGDHPRDHRSGVRRASAVGRRTRAHGNSNRSRTARRQDRPGHRPGRRRRVRGRPPAGDLQRAPHPVATAQGGATPSTSSPKSSSTSARTASAPSR